MKKLSKLLMTILVLLSITTNAQLKNKVTATVKIYGNCGMCEENIEKATITYDSQKTNLESILKQIALAGYDSDQFLAPSDTYSKLPSCCQYDREAKIADISNNKSEEIVNKHTDNTIIQETNQLKPIFENYFAIKEALVKTDGNTASTKATALLSAINAVKMELLKSDEHIVWMKVIANLKEDAEHIADTKEVTHQRDHFITLSKSSYQLIKVTKQESPTYYQHCPMANDGKGAYWLSKENNIKNPYFGSKMLTCGKTVETIK